MRDLILSLAIPILLLAVVLWFVGAFIIDRLRLRIRGWIVSGHGRDEIAYEERGKGAIVFWAELMGCGPPDRIIRLPGPNNWEAKVPAWAHGHRDEIIARIKQSLPESRYEYRTEE